MDHLPRIAVTMGDPSGIGPEVVARALLAPGTSGLAHLTVIGDRALLTAWADHLDGTIDFVGVDEPGEGRRDGSVGILDRDTPPGAAFPVGRIDATAARTAHRWIERAARACLAGEVDAMVTGPVNKAAFQAAGISDTGHQEILQRLSGAPHVVTMLVSGGLRCVHLSTHKPLREACAYVTRPNVLRAIELTQASFAGWGFARPRIAVAALNPHASDGGLIGREELDEIAPAIDNARSLGIEVSGPHPADSVFNQAIAGRYDVVVVMYHDQGHIAIKVHGFEESVSVNLGLPFIRTSVDHGTAFDIAGKGLADGTSMVEAIRLAASLAMKAGLGAPAVSARG